MYTPSLSSIATLGGALASTALGTGGIVVATRNGNVVETIVVEKPFVASENHPLTCVPKKVPLGYKEHFNKPEEVVLKYDCSFVLNKEEHSKGGTEVIQLSVKG